jgi:hypothetical protein
MNTDRNRRNSQCRALLRLLEAAADRPLFHNGGWVPLPIILTLGIASHTRRISDLRAAGYDIRCEKERTESGQLRTRYRLVKPDAGKDAASSHSDVAATTADHTSATVLRYNETSRLRNADTQK